jgi:cytochrome c oxidase accessory protein FixG
MSKPRKHIPIQPDDGDLYAAQKKIYPREVHGRFRRLRTLASFALLGLFYLLPWITWDERQAVLFDLPARKFYIFGLTFWPQDFFYLALLLIIAALALFFFTALAGRLWCGYACPQTVWTDAFLWMERVAEGPRHKRMKLDQGPWTGEKILRKSFKQAMWIGFAAFTGFIFVGYFTPVEQLWENLLTFNLGPWELFWGVFYGLATYGNAGFLREQVCLYMCPYARFQSAMFDNNSLIISYDTARGEPRGGRKRGIDPKSRSLGSCIDCNLCVQACPTGIDIRDGLQYECIACAACIDACDDVMDKMGYERGLIRYTSDNAMNAKPVRILRPRVLIYGALLLGLSVAFVGSIALRTPLDLEILRDRNVMYRELDDGRIENVYTLKIMNKDHTDHRYQIAVSGLPGLEVQTDPAQLAVASGEVATVLAWVRVDPDSLQRPGEDIVFYLRSRDNPQLSVESRTRFQGPRNF